MVARGAISRWPSGRCRRWIQDRHGPNRVGPAGLLQPAGRRAQEHHEGRDVPERTPTCTLFVLAPAIAFIPAMPHLGRDSVRVARCRRRGASSTWSSPRCPVGFLFILAISSLGVYGIVLAGWSSNNKYALLGGLRSSAQMVSYEIAMGMATIPVLLLSGNVALNDIVHAAGARRVERPRAHDRVLRVPRSRRSPRPTVCRSICPRPNRSWWPATTPSTAR